MKEESSNRAGNEAVELLRLLGEQRELYAQLAALAEHQRALITGNQPERLLAVLADRQKIIDRLTRLTSAMKPYQQDWAAIRGRLDKPIGEKVDALVSEVNALLTGILERDRCDAELLADCKSRTATAMKQVKTHRAAGAAYAASSNVACSRVEWTD